MKTIQGEARLGSPKTARQLLDMYFLDMRCALLETAAAMDRIERAEGGEDIHKDIRLKNIKDALEIIKNGKDNRAEQFLRLFSE